MLFIWNKKEMYQAILGRQLTVMVFVFWMEFLISNFYLFAICFTITHFVFIILLLCYCWCTPIYRSGRKLDKRSWSALVSAYCYFMTFVIVAHPGLKVFRKQSKRICRSCRIRLLDVFSIWKLWPVRLVDILFDSLNMLPVSDKSKDLF